MGKGAPTYSPPPPPTLPTADQLFSGGLNFAKANTPQLPTAQDLYSQGTNYAKTTAPMAFGARESALTDLQNPTQYYGSFQPTSLESALGNQYFSNVWPDVQKSIMNNLSLSGLSSSPVLANTLARQQGNLETNIGSYLADQANNRATNSLTARLGIDPMSMITPYVNTGQQQGNNQANLFSNYLNNFATTGMNQGNAQAQMQNDYQQQLAQAQYQQQVNKYNQQMALAKTIGMISPIGGAIYGGISGGAPGFQSSLSGSTDTLQSILAAYGGGMGGGGSANNLGRSGVGGGNFGSSVNPSRVGGY
mgnify:CR=1 FL=1